MMRRVWTRSILVGSITLVSAVADGQDWNNYLRVSFIDVGQGDAILIQTPDGPNGGPGKSILIDGGPDKGSKNRTLSYLESFGLARGTILDYVILTHPHDDHDKGLLDILDVYQVRTIIDPGIRGNGTYNDFVEKAEDETANGQPSTYIRLRQRPNPLLDWGSGIEAQILWNDRANVEGLGRGGTRTNNSSVVIRMVFGDFSFLLTGDAEGKARNQPETTIRYLEKVLVDTSPDLLCATVLKVAHHGIETSSTLPFIRAVQPQVAVVQSGRRRVFGRARLPDQSVLNRYYREFPGVEIVRTDLMDTEERRTAANDEDGDDIFMFSDGSELRVLQARLVNGRREWVTVKVLRGAPCPGRRR